MAKARAANAHTAIAQQEASRPPIIESVVNEMGHADDSPHQITLLKSVQQAALDAGERRCERFGLVEIRGHQFGAVPFEIRRLRGNLPMPSPTWRAAVCARS